MASTLRVQVEQPTRDKKWVAVAVDWPGFERGAKDEAGAIEKLQAYVPRYLPVAKRARLGAELERQTQLEVVERYRGVGSTDFWGISFAPSSIDRLPMDPEVFERNVRLLRAAWDEFDAVSGRVSADLRPGPRGGGRDRDRIRRHVLLQEGEDFAKRVKVPATPRSCTGPTVWRPTVTGSSTRCATGTPRASRSATGRSPTCSATPPTTCSITRGRWRTATSALRVPLADLSCAPADRCERCGRR